MTIIDDYLKLTEKYSNEYGEKTILLMQVGSFFECYALVNSDNEYYGSHIKSFAEINDMIISRKNVSHKGISVVMAGFGLPQLEKYVKRLQDNDFTVVIYTQDSNTKNTTRSLSCIYSPGTFFSNDTTNMSNTTTCIWLHYSSTNQIMKEHLTIGISSIDIFTGKTNVYEYTIDFLYSPSTFDELEKYISIHNPSECIIIYNKHFENIANYANINCKIHYIDINEQSTLTTWAKNSEKQKYQKEIFDLFYSKQIFDDFSVYTQSFCFLLEFIYKHNPNLVKKLYEPSFENSSNKLILANHSLKQLNIISDNRYTGKLSSLCSFLNNTITVMGKRAFNHSILNPLCDEKLLNIEYSITEHLIENKNWEFIRDKLSSIKDISKIYRKLILGKLSPKDFFILHNSLQYIIDLYDFVLLDSNLNNYINDSNIKTYCNLLIDNINLNLNIKKCSSIDDFTIDKLNNYDLQDIFIFNDNVSDNLNNKLLSSINASTKFEQVRTFFDNSLIQVEKNKSKYNNELIKIHETPKNDPVIIGTTRRINIIKKMLEDKSIETDLINLSTIEFKTHTGSNSIITSPELIYISKNVNKSRDNLTEELIIQFSKYLMSFIDLTDSYISSIINFVVNCDLLQNKCYIATKYNYCKPSINNYEKSFLSFEGIRHPLIEHINTNELYVSNDLSDFGKKLNGILLYGTNAVGKTSFIKSIGIAIIMAQSGLYVPCSKFEYSIYNTLFTRILGNDNMFKGLSTFTVEMTELRSIIKLANSNTLILGDELCSGTESTSALSIFTAGIEYLNSVNSTFIFATHFHEIVNYSEIINLNTVHLYHMSVIYDKTSNKLIYDRKLKIGPGENMYGLEVCKSLDLPQNFLERAHEIRIKYSKNNIILDSKPSTYNASKLKGLCEMCKLVNGTEFHHLKHQKNFTNTTYMKNHKANLINICEDCHNKLHIDNKEHRIYKTTDGYEILST
mgnify:CR=1 FL=1